MSTEDKPRPKFTAILMEGGVGNSAIGNTIIGADVGVEMRGEVGSRADGNFILTTEALRIFHEAEQRVAAADLAAEERAKVLKQLHELRATVGKPSYASKYLGFVSAVSAHVGLLPLLTPFLGPLAGLGG